MYRRIFGVPLFLVLLVLSVVFLFVGCALSHNLYLIVTKPDNVPIVLMMIVFAFFTWFALDQAHQNDELLKKGDRVGVLKRMQR